MAFRISGIIMMVAGAALLLLFDTDLVKAFAGSSVIMGFLIVGLDIMRRSIEKKDWGTV